MQAWRKRFFCLRSSKVLEYYKSVDGDLKGVVNLEDCKAVHSDLSHKKYKNVFDIETKDRTFYFVASSQEEMKAWVNIICSVCSFSLQNTPPSSTSTLTPGPTPTSGISFNERFKPVENGATADSLYSLATESSVEVKRQLKGGDEVPTGVSLSQALALKGMGNGAQRTATMSSPGLIYPMSGLQDYNYFSPRPVGVNDPQGIYSLAQESQAKGARSATLMPGTRLGDKDIPQLSGHRPLQQSSSLGGNSSDSDIIGMVGGQGLLTSASPTLSSASARTEPGHLSPGNSNRAEMLENGYMAPRKIQRPPAYDYLPFGPPRPAYQHGGTGSGTTTQSHSTLLKLDERMRGGEVGVATPPTPTSSSAVVAGRPPTYVNVPKLKDDEPPPIDRSTKPTPPIIDRTLKPGTPKNTPPKDDDGCGFDEGDEESDSSDSSPEVSKKQTSSSSVPFNVADLPKPTSRTTQYTQVEFDSNNGRPKLSADEVMDDVSNRAPVPIPRDHPVPKPRRVNYTDIDLTATAARKESPKPRSRSPTPRLVEDEHLQGLSYVNVNRLGEVDDDTDPDYYTHMKVSDVFLLLSLLLSLYPPPFSLLFLFLLSRSCSFCLYLNSPLFTCVCVCVCRRGPEEDGCC